MSALMRWAFFASALVACGGGQSNANTNAPAPSVDTARPVLLGEWCHSLTQVMCIRAGSCIGSLEIATTCQESAQPACLASRPDDTPSGRNAGDLDACEKTFQSLPCDGYMGAVQTHSECQARTP